MADSEEEELQKDKKMGIKDYAELTSGLAAMGGLAKNLVGRSATTARTVPFVGPAVGLPIQNGPIASQALRGVTGILPEVAPEAGAILPEAAEVIGAGLIGAGEVASASIALPLTALALGGTGLYYLGKKLFDKNPEDRVAKSIVNHEVQKNQRAKVLVNQMFDKPASVDISKSVYDNEPVHHDIINPMLLANQPIHQHHDTHYKHKIHKTKHHKKK